MTSIGIRKELDSLTLMDNHAEPLPERELFESMEEAYKNLPNPSKEDPSVDLHNLLFDLQLPSEESLRHNLLLDHPENRDKDAASWDAYILCLCIQGAKKYPVLTCFTEQSKKRWEVWQRGYGCFCDVDGVLYCYKRP
jgi:hypothetical protein